MLGPLPCWLCGQPITDPPEIIGQYIAGQVRRAHRHCLQILGESDLQLPPDPGEHRDAAYHHDGGP